MSLLSKRSKRGQNGASQIRSLKPDSEPVDEFDAVFGDEPDAQDDFFDDNFDSEPIASQPTGSGQVEAGFVVGAGITKITVDKVLEDGSWILDTGYHVPAKRRTPEEVARLRRQLRTKLLASPQEADKWDRYDDSKCAIIEERLQTVLNKMGVFLQEDDHRTLLNGLLDDLLGFGAIQPLVDNKEYSEIMVNGPEMWSLLNSKASLQETR